MSCCYSVFHLGLGILFLTIALSTLKGEPDEDGHCIWYDKCNIDNATLGSLACLYTGPPILVSNDSMPILEDICPMFIDPSGSLPELCCSYLQIAEMQASFLLPRALLQRCPTCWRNFQDHICSMTCGPAQSKYLMPTGFIPGDDQHPDQLAITEMSFYVTEQFADGFYGSCKDVQFGTPGVSVMNLMCGPWGAENCTAKRLLDYMGSKENGYTPIQIDYILQNEPFVLNGTQMYPLDIPMTPCNLPVENGTDACNCTDCPAACPPDKIALHQLL